LAGKVTRTVFKITAVTTANDYNNGTTTFLQYGHVLPARKMLFDPVRSYTGRLRQVDIHQDLVQATFGLKFVGATMDALEALILQLEADLITGGTLEYRELGGYAYMFAMGVSDGPEIKRDEAFRNGLIAHFEISPNLAPWWSATPPEEAE